MIKHIVAWNFPDERDGMSKPAIVAEVHRRLTDCAGIVEGMRTFEVVPAQPGLEASFDMVLYSEFDDVDALQAYIDHPTHQLASGFISKMRTDRIAFDYDTAEVMD